MNLRITNLGKRVTPKHYSIFYTLKTCLPYYIQVKFYLAASSEFSIVRDWEYNGNDLDPIVNASSFTECRTQCYQDVNCKAFTWSTSFSYRSKSRCNLKSSIGRGGRRKLGHVSGHRLGKRDQ